MNRNEGPNYSSGAESQCSGKLDPNTPVQLVSLDDELIPGL